MKRVFFRALNLPRRLYGTFKEEWESQDMPVVDYSSKSSKTVVYGWGLAGNGELGSDEFFVQKTHRLPLTHTWSPRRLPFSNGKKVKLIACGHGFTVFATTSAVQPKLFGTGVNTNGQLGFHEHSKEKDKSFSWLIEPGPITLPLRSGSTKITHLSCGVGHTVVATDKEGLFSLGNNSVGQCGRKVVENEDYGTYPRVHKVLNVATPIKQLVCGFDHTLVLTNEGRVIAFGLGTDGQLGDELFNSNWMPTEVGGDLKNEKVVQLTTSGDCCLAVTDKGDVFGWGNSEYKQLSSITTGLMVGTPANLKLKIGKVKKVAAGGSVCMALTESGQVYIWGYGFLGLGPENMMKSEPTLLPPPLFGANAYNPDVTVVDIFAGVMNFAAVNSNGQLYMWGKNHFGSLGFHHLKEQFFPLKVDVGYKIVSVALGLYHTVVLAKIGR